MNYPEERIAYIEKDSGAKIILSQEIISEIAKNSSPKKICKTSPKNSAYIIYTSGSTGKPKGTTVYQKFRHVANSRLQLQSGRYYGGETLSNVTSDDVTVYNKYGLTEFTCATTYFIFEKGVTYGAVHIGRPVPNCSVFVFGKFGNLLLRGAVGELLPFQSSNCGELLEVS